MGLFNKINSLQKKVSAKQNQAQAKKLQKLRTQRIKIEGKAKLKSYELKEKKRIAKAQGILQPKRILPKNNLLGKQEDNSPYWLKKKKVEDNTPYWLK